MINTTEKYREFYVDENGKKVVRSANLFLEQEELKKRYGDRMTKPDEYYRNGIRAGKVTA